MQYKLDQLAQTIHQNVIDYHSSKKEETIKKILDISKSAIRLSVQEELNNVIAAYLELVQCLTSHYTIATSYLATEAEKDKDSLIHLLSDLTEIFSTNDEDPMGNHVDLVPLRERSRSMSVDDFTEQLSSISEENIPTKDTLHIVSGRIIQYIMCIFDSMRYVSYTPNLK
ncbi:hypothetical protein BDF14DRAFT_949029 [Spinellus fusiger]|nr:hypothetical protein BDF14DRAFT_949029 [Spinellus fusiger]